MEENRLESLVVRFGFHHRLRSKSGRSVFPYLFAVKPHLFVNELLTVTPIPPISSSLFPHMVQPRSRYFYVPSLILSSLRLLTLLFIHQFLHSGTLNVRFKLYPNLCCVWCFSPTPSTPRPPSTITRWVGRTTVSF